MRTSFLPALFGAVLIATAACAAAAAPHPDMVADEWPTYGHDPGGMRYSPLTQITPANVSALQPVWTYHMKPAGASSAPPATAPSDPEAQGGFRRGRYAASEATPIVIKGVMYLPTPYGRVVALDAQTGRQIWAYELAGRDQPATRGVEYWPGTAG
jgi:quinoprotein glucose dehydrogenase